MNEHIAGNQQYTPLQSKMQSWKQLFSPDAQRTDSPGIHQNGVQK